MVAIKLTLPTKLALLLLVTLSLPGFTQEIISLSCVGQSERVIDYTHKSPVEKVKASIDIDIKREKIKIEGLVCLTQSSGLYRLFGDNQNKPEEDRLACIGWLDAKFDEKNIYFYLKSNANQPALPAVAHFNLSRVFSDVVLEQTVKCAVKSCTWSSFVDTTKLECKRAVQQF